MGDVLAGNNAVWDFEPDAVVIRYSRGVWGSRLLQALGERRLGEVHAEIAVHQHPAAALERAVGNVARERVPHVDGIGFHVE